MFITTKRYGTKDPFIKHPDADCQIDVLKWFDNKYADLVPYKLKTDGKETQYNKGGILFENFWQGSKVFHPLKKHQIDSIGWKQPYEGDVLKESFDSTKPMINYELYIKFRDNIWNFKKGAIRYPVGCKDKARLTKFALLTDRFGKESRLDYVQARKQIYVKEYIRLVRKTELYHDILDLFKNGKTIQLSEVDMPFFPDHEGERGRWRNVNLKKDDPFIVKDVNNHCIINPSLLVKLLNCADHPFGHGLALIYSIYYDMGFKLDKEMDALLKTSLDELEKLQEHIRKGKFYDQYIWDDEEREKYLEECRGVCNPNPYKVFDRETIENCTDWRDLGLA